VLTPTLKGIGGKVRSNKVREKEKQDSRFSRPEIEWCDKAHVHAMLYRYRKNYIEETLKIPHNMIEMRFGEAIRRSLAHTVGPRMLYPVHKPCLWQPLVGHRYLAQALGELQDIHAV
jgi:hypothetical protein